MSDKSKSDGVKEAQLEILRTVIESNPISCSGTVPVSPDDLILFYRKGKEPGLLNFADASDVSADSEALGRLTKVCDAVRLDGENDNAGSPKTLKKGLFLSSIDAEKLGIFDIIRADLLEGFASGRPMIRAELQELCVNEKDSFIKPRQKSEPSPKNENLIGKLIIVLPTEHEGGQIVLRSEDKESIFDPSKAIKEYSENHPGQHCVAYAAFYNSTSYEAARIASGFRVSLSFDLFFNEPRKCSEPEIEVQASLPAPVHTPLASGLVFKAALARLLADPTFLPEGGYLGFRLRQKYPLEQPDKEGVVLPISTLGELMKRLRGSDAMLARVCKDLGLLVGLRMLYYTGVGDEILMKQILRFESDLLDSESYGIVEALQDLGGKLLARGEDSVPRGYDPTDPEDIVDWVTRPHANLNKLETIYVDQDYKCSSVSTIIGYPCFFIHVGPHKIARRTTVSQD